MTKRVYLLYRIQKGIDWGSRDEDVLEGATLSLKSAKDWVDYHEKETKRKRESGFVGWRYISTVVIC